MLTVPPDILSTLSTRPEMDLARGVSEKAKANKKSESHLDEAFDHLLRNQNLANEKKEAPKAVAKTDNGKVRSESKDLDQAEAPTKAEVKKADLNSTDSASSRRNAEKPVADTEAAAPAEESRVNEEVESEETATLLQWMASQKPVENQHATTSIDSLAEHHLAGVSATALQKSQEAVTPELKKDGEATNTASLLELVEKLSATKAPEVLKAAPAVMPKVAAMEVAPVKATKINSMAVLNHFALSEEVEVPVKEQKFSAKDFEQKESKDSGVSLKSFSDSLWVQNQLQSQEKVSFQDTLVQATAEPTAVRSQLVEDMKPLIHQVMMNDKGGSMSLSLKPGHLGMVKVAIEVENSQVKVSIQAAESSAKSMLEQRSGDLKDQLTKAGLKVGEVTVSSMSVQSADTKQDFSQAHEDKNSYQNQSQGRDQQTWQEADKRQENREADLLKFGGIMEDSERSAA